MQCECWEWEGKQQPLFSYSSLAMGLGLSRNRDAVLSEAESSDCQAVLGKGALQIACGI